MAGTCPRIDSEDSVDRKASGETCRVEGRHDIYLGVNRVAEGGSNERVLCCFVKGKPSPGRAREVAGGVADLSGGENPEDPALGRVGQMASSQESGCHSWGGAGDDADANHGSVVFRVWVKGVDVSHMRDGRDSYCVGQSCHYRCLLDVTVSGYQPFEVMTHGRWGEAKKGTAGT